MTLSRDDYRALRGEPARWLPWIAELCARHGLPADGLRPLGGSNLVAAAGDAIVKLFPPFLRYQWEAERPALGALAGHPLPVAVPRILYEGERDGWPYLVLDRLPGTPLDELWPGASAAQRVDLLAQIGALIAAVQEVPPAPPAKAQDWDAFLARQVEGCQARHERLGLPAHLLAELPTFIARGTLPRVERPVLLTGEYTPFNLLAVERPGGWTITGLIDFGDAMAGAPIYDLLGAATFLAAGHAEGQRALCNGFGLTDLTPALAEDLLRLLLLHRHSDLAVQIAIPGWREAPSLPALARLIWPF